MRGGRRRATCWAKVLAAPGVDAQSIAAIGVSCQAPSLVAVDAQGVPVHPALIWMDRRSEPQCDALRATVDEALITRINGGRIDPYFLAPKLLWLRETRPTAYARCHTFCRPTATSSTS
jgi:xylulokinase